MDANAAICRAPQWQLDTKPSCWVWSESRRLQALHNVHWCLSSAECASDAVALAVRRDTGRDPHDCQRRDRHTMEHAKPQLHRLQAVRLVSKRDRLQAAGSMGWTRQRLRLGNDSIGLERHQPRAVGVDDASVRVIGRVPDQIASIHKPVGLDASQHDIPRIAKRPRTQQHTGGTPNVAPNLQDVPDDSSQICFHRRTSDCTRKRRRESCAGRADRHSKCLQHIVHDLLFACVLGRQCHEPHEFADPTGDTAWIAQAVA